jgi:hypothetical protein
MQNEFGPVPPILIPLMGTVTLKKIVEGFRKKCHNVYVGIKEGAEAIENYCNFFPDPAVKLVKVEQSKSLAECILGIMESDLDISKHPIVLNFGDTIVQDLNPELIGQDFISFARTSETERWTLFTDENGKISKISDKTYLLNPETWKTFIGVWGFRDSKLFFDILSEENHRNTSEAFYSAITQYADERPVVLHESKNWIDIGHVDNYFDARKKEINTRSLMHSC